MIVYKLEWSTQKDDNKNTTQSEFYMTKELAEAKKKLINNAAELIALTGLSIWVAEIEVIEQGENNEPNNNEL